MGDAVRLGARGMVRTAAMFALWLMLVDTTVTAELVVGAGCAVLAGVLGTALSRRGAVQARFRPWMLRRAYRPFALLVTDSARVSWALIRALAGRPAHGRLRAARYVPGGNPEDAGRRILTEILGSLAPNRYVVGIDRERGVLLVHELVPDDGPLDPLELG